MARIEASFISRILFGKPLSTDEAPHQTVTKRVGLAVFASDALSSVAYASQEILLVLFAAGTGGLHFSLPISGAIVGILFLVAISYRQTIYAYPSGGGAYVVARDNLGIRTAQVAGGALLLDYVLTVAVSLSSGTDQIVSAFPQLAPYQVPLALSLLGVMTLVNLRGVKESGAIFAIPTYFFVGTMGLTLAVGFYRHFLGGGLAPIGSIETVKTISEPLGLFLILHAFSSGCTALTGVEAISNGIQAFKEPKSANAAKTLTIMSFILGTFFLSITYLANKAGALPSDQETVISQLGRAIFERNSIYFILMAATTSILIMAANTSFADFPRLCALQAGDGFLPRQLTFRSSRLVYGWGIVFLASSSALLITIFQAHTSALIPLYAIGVFLCFTLSQTGMVVHWWKLYRSGTPEPYWSLKMVLNAVGAFICAGVTIVFSVTRFHEGAWVTVVVIPTLVFIFTRIHAHYQRVFAALKFGKMLPPASTFKMRTIILLDDVHQGTLGMVNFAQSLGHPWMAVHVDYDDKKSEVVRQRWIQWMGNDEHLKIVISPYRRLIGPVRDFILGERDRHPGTLIHVVTGQVVIEDQFARVLHSKNARGLLDELQIHSGIIVTGVPIQV